MLQKYGAFGAIFFVSVFYSNAHANDAHNTLAEQSEVRRLMFWTGHMKDAGRDCVVTEDFFMGFDKENAAYWSVNCNNSRDIGVIVQIPNTVGGKTRIMECSIANAIGVPCFKKME